MESAESFPMPLLTIPLDALADQLLARRIAPDDYAVAVEAGEHGRLSVGRINRRASRPLQASPPLCKVFAFNTAK